MTLYIACSLIVLPLAGCGGRTANPVSAIQAGDEGLSCSALRVEMASVQSEVQALIPDSKKTGKNVALGTAGLFLLVPLFFMDFSGAEKAEIRAYRERYGALQRTYASKNCDDSSLSTVNQSIAGDSTPKMRLEALKTLHDEGLISDEELEKSRAKILEEL